MRRWSAIVGLLAFLSLVVPLFARAHLTQGAGEPVLPDLRTLPPAALSLKAEVMDDKRSHYLLRFDNTVGNWGGPLEIVANLERSRDLYQNVYDAYSDGQLVSSTKVSSDLVYHPTHNHFHFQDFATYQLLKKDASGIYQPTARVGTKTSFCIVDTIRVAQLGSGASTHRSCTASIQGLSAGWADVYKADLPEQWIDFGTATPASGDYAIQSTVDPSNRLLESNDSNNTAITYFTIRSGRLSTANQLPTCSLTPATGQVGSTVNLACVRFMPGDKVDLRWGSQSSAILQTVTVPNTGNVTASLTIPESTLGVHYFYLTSQTTNRTVLATFNTSSTIALSSSQGTVGSPLNLTLRGFAANEKITVRFTTTGATSVILGTATADALGSATVMATVPPSVLGAHKVEAKGAVSKKAILGSFTVSPSISAQPSTIQAGGKVAIGFEGFKKSETVTISLVETGATLKSIRAGSTGGASPSTANSVTLPADLSPGAYKIQATGKTSRVTVTVRIMVTGSGPSVSETDRKSSTPKATATPKPAEPTRAPRPRDRATEVPTNVLTATATEAPPPTETPAPTETAAPTETPAPTETSEPEEPGDEELDINSSVDSEGDVPEEDA